MYTGNKIDIFTVKQTNYLRFVAAHKICFSSHRMKMVLHFSFFYILFVFFYLITNYIWFRQQQINRVSLKTDKIRVKHYSWNHINI